MILDRNTQRTSKPCDEIKTGTSEDATSTSSLPVFNSKFLAAFEFCPWPNRPSNKTVTDRHLHASSKNCQKNGHLKFPGGKKWLTKVESVDTNSLPTNAFFDQVSSFTCSRIRDVSRHLPIASGRVFNWNDRALGMGRMTFLMARP